ncbi:Crp/Fnr family transcriptional regulator [Filibacter tadaridae]|uniref:Global nitrogen regulator n=1 Tax=Filibacter tadaridae TaxID=2483811 RepID=A0A3P5X1W3_9BACL|nr:Crp/Fnr family transcriptional regulator [Filibacter tadaridae]VDC28110.1 Global nitrogen regulator [Filibacter tadaridae]
MDQVRELMRGVKLFKDLSDEELTPFLTIIRRNRFADKNMIFMHDAPITHVYFVASGKVKVFRNDFAGKEQIICVKQKNDMFPHVGFFRQGNYPAHAQAIEDTILFSISIRDFEEVLIANPHLSIKLFRVLGDQIVDLQQRLEEMALRSTNERILLLLLRLSETHCSENKEGWNKVNTHFTNMDLANMIGTTRESVNRMISLLKKEDAVKLIDGKYFIHPNRVRDKLYK